MRAAPCDSSALAQRYGPWAILAGASEGVGCELARQVAANGVNCILIARREKPLAELAELIRAASRVECIPASIDLATADAFDRIVATAGSREVGLYVNNAGADPNASRFLDRNIETDPLRGCSPPICTDVRRPRGGQPVDRPSTRLGVNRSTKSGAPHQNVLPEKDSRR